jgi:hypothetical protein
VLGEGNVISSPNFMDVAIGFIAAAPSLAGCMIGRIVDAVMIVARIA